MTYMCETLNFIQSTKANDTKTAYADAKTCATKNVQTRNSCEPIYRFKNYSCVCLLLSYTENKEIFSLIFQTIIVAVCWKVGDINKTTLMKAILYSFMLHLD